MRALSKSKLMAFRQCPKRLWLEVHHPELREDSAATQKEFEQVAIQTRGATSSGISLVGVVLFFGASLRV
jgi:hypothetical protein